MNLDEIPSSERLEFTVRPARPDATLGSLASGAVNLRAGKTAGEYWLSQKDQTLLVAVRDGEARLNLDRVLIRNGARLAFVTRVASPGVAHVVLHAYHGAVLELGEIEIGVDEKIFESSRKRAGWRDVNVEELATRLTRLCAFGVPEDLVFIDAGADEAVEDAGIANGFLLIGPDFDIALHPFQRAQGETILRADRLIFSHRKRGRAVRLVHGRAKFSDQSRTRVLRALAVEAMRELIHREDGYLRNWDAYGRLEGESLLDEARRIGALAFTTTEQAPEGIRFQLERPLSARLPNGTSFEISRELPAWLADPDMSWKDWLETKLPADSSGPRPPSAESFALVSVGQQGVTLRIDGRSPIPRGFLIPSLTGDEVQVERRRKARDAILAGLSANPTLGMIIEDGTDPPCGAAMPGIEPLSARTRRKVFQHDPTRTQINAIGVALNTPDIAIIQGPPGTGKTTVISAIVERLSELHDPRRSVAGKVLVTGFQHDAVENVVSRLSVNSLPPVKFGTRRAGEDASTLKDMTTKWRLDLADRLRARNPAIALWEEERRLAEAAALYLGAPSPANARAALERVLASPPRMIGKALATRARSLLDKVEEESAEEADPTREAILATIRRLRTTPHGFADDGPETAAAVLAACGGQIGGREKELLKRVASERGAVAPETLAELRSVQERLLGLYSPPLRFRVDKPNEEVIETLDAASRRMEEAKQRELDPTDEILLDLLRRLETSPDSVDLAIRDYNFVYAATCQQAEGAEIRRAKNRDDQRDPESRIVYDTVIVDEAARVAPRDLLIPMAQGERRIILVGDHRQLPHLIDEKIVRDIENGAEEAPPNSAEAWARAQNASLFEISMFEHLISRLRKMEKKDGIPRIVTLDAQYRMHPVLGRFVSAQFYEPHAEGYASPLPAEFFAHRLQGVEGVPAAWLEVPAALGRDERGGTSFRRRCEAEAVAKRLVDWIRSEEGRGLSFGVVSFYKAQVEALMQALLPYGLTEPAADGELVVAGPYRLLDAPPHGGAPEERLRIGTVDAFQGKEFDVVLLSMTRASPPERRDARPIPANRLFGHMTSPNRLCVSMSRQKRLLVVAGDSNLVQRPEAAEGVPALQAFHRLCREQGAMI